MARELRDIIPTDAENKTLPVDEANVTAPGKPVIEEVGSELAKKKKRKIEDAPKAPEGQPLVD